MKEMSKPHSITKFRNIKSNNLLQEQYKLVLTSAVSDKGKKIGNGIIITRKYTTLLSGKLRQFKTKKGHTSRIR